MGIVRGDQQAGLPVAEDLRQPAVGAGDHAAAGRRRLERRVRQGIGPCRGDHDDAGRRVQLSRIGYEADEADSVGDSERLGQPAELDLPVLLTRPGVAGDEGGGSRDEGDRPEQNLLALPRGDPPEHRADDRSVAGRSVVPPAPRPEDRDAVAEHDGLRLAGELVADGRGDARQGGGRLEHAAVGRPGRLGVDLADVPDVRHAGPPGGERPRDRDRRVRVDERDPPAGREAGRRGDPQAEPDETPRRELAPTEHGQPLDVRLDARGPQLADEGAVLGEHDDWSVAVAIESAGDQGELAVGPVAAGRRMQVEDRPPGQSATSRISSAGVCASPGWRISASSSRPSTRRGPGREK